MIEVSREKKYVYNYSRDYITCTVYGYDLNTIPDMITLGWTLTGTFYDCVTFRKDF